MLEHYKSKKGLGMKEQSLIYMYNVLDFRNQLGHYTTLQAISFYK